MFEHLKPYQIGQKEEGKGRQERGTKKRCGALYVYMVLGAFIVKVGST